MTDRKDTKLVYGPVFVQSGTYEGRIGYYDNDEARGIAVVYFGHPLMCGEWYEIPFRFLKKVTMSDLLARRNELKDQLIDNAYNVKKLSSESEIAIHRELDLVNEELYERIYFGRYGEHIGKGCRVFLSHSSKDKWFVRQVHEDVKNLGHEPWLDENNIKAGDSISEGIERGLEQNDFVVIFLSKNAVESNWVRVEWEAKFHEEITSGRVKVIPSLIENVKIPTLLRMKKYADFRKSYDEGLEEILTAIGHKSDLHNTG